MQGTPTPNRIVVLVSLALALAACASDADSPALPGPPDAASSDEEARITGPLQVPERCWVETLRNDPPPTDTWFPAVVRSTFQGCLCYPNGDRCTADQTGFEPLHDPPMRCPAGELCTGASPTSNGVCVAPCVSYGGLWLAGYACCDPEQRCRLIATGEGPGFSACVPQGPEHTPW